MGNKTMTLGSLFDGSGGFPLAGMLAGITPVWSSEISPFPVLVTHKRLPEVKHYGDVSALKGSELEPVDIITFGSPCQDLSIAGRRAGILDGARSNLFFQAIRIIKEMREATNGKYPRYFVWENVPGAFTSNGGDDFQAVLEAVVGIKEEGIEVPAPADHRWGKADVLLGDGWSVAWRVLDSQYFGVPQRRSRIFLVGDLAGERAGEVLFKSEGVSGYSSESFRAWQRAAGGAEDGTGTSGCRSDAEGRDAGSGGSQGGCGRYCLNPQGNSGIGIIEEKTLALVAQDHGNHPAVLHSAGFCTEHSAQSRSIGYEEEKSPTLRAGVVPAALMFDNHAQDARYNGPKENSPTVTARYGTGGNNQPLVAEPRAYGVCSKASNAMLSDNPHSGFYEAKTSRTLDRGGGNPSANQGGICIVEPVEKPKAYALQGSMIGRDDKNGPNGSGVNEEVSFTLTGMDHHAVCYGIGRDTLNQGEKSQFMPTVNEEVQPTMVAKGPGGAAVPTYSASKASFFTAAEEELANTLVASDYKDPPLINDNEIEYAVRRLTPTECARLQGFPDWWCSDLAITDPTEEVLSYWTDVWNTWQRITGKKPKTEKQVRKWLADPYKDSDEYTLWGNGVSLPVVFFVLSGIVWADSKED